MVRILFNCPAYLTQVWVSEKNASGKRATGEQKILQNVEKKKKKYSSDKRFCFTLLVRCDEATWSGVYSMRYIHYA